MQGNLERVKAFPQLEVFQTGGSRRDSANKESALDDDLGSCAAARAPFGDAALTEFRVPLVARLYADSHALRLTVCLSVLTYISRHRSENDFAASSPCTPVSACMFACYPRLFHA